MTKATKDTWEIVLNFRASQDTFNSKNNYRTGFCNKLRFRIRTGQDKIDMVVGDFVRALQISKWSLTFNSPPTITVYPWFFMKQGGLKKENVTSPELEQVRPIQVYLPPSFKENIYKPYQVLFLNDGQFLDIAIASLHLDKEITSKQLNEFIVVGIENNMTERTSLLTPSNGTTFECKNGTFANRCQSCNISCLEHLNCTKAEFRVQITKCLKVLPTVPKGEKYLDFIQYSLLTYVHLNYRALTEQKNVGIMGYSLGGLISCHAAWTRPAVFGSAVCSSPSFWWPVPLGKYFPFGAQFEFINKTLSKFQDKRPLQRIYIDMGSAEGDFLMVDASKRAANRMAETPYFEFDRNLWLMILDKQNHSLNAFLSRSWQPLYTLYGSEGSLNVKSNREGGSACAVSASFMTILFSLMGTVMHVTSSS